ncbi:MAG TPA: acyl-CoA dehydratase activase [Bacillota bacterium]|nr:acyl-CoA dehydratase activase [Bacillota bacterium]
MERSYLGIDVGSVTTNMVLLDESGAIKGKVNLRTEGRPIPAVQEGLAQLRKAAGEQSIAGVATTGSARELIGRMVGADLVKNEITAHAVAALHCRPDVRTIIEIGGQDSKIIIIRDGLVVDFAMNTVCAAGTGSFLDQQAARLNIPIQSFGALAMQSRNPVTIAGRCAVFAESDMIHKQQIGHSLSDIAAGLCQALVRNYLNNVGKGKDILPAILFQGGVAANLGMRWAFEEHLHEQLYIPEDFDVMGALGAALLVRRQMIETKASSSFTGWQLCSDPIVTEGRSCDGCANRCEIIALKKGENVYAYIGDRCGKWNIGT